MANFFSLNHQIINSDHIVRIEMTKTQECSAIEDVAAESTKNGATDYLRPSNLSESPQMQFTDTGFLIKVHLSSGHHISFDIIKEAHKAEALYQEIEQLLGVKKLINSIN